MKKHPFVGSLVPVFLDTAFFTITVVCLPVHRAAAEPNVLKIPDALNCELPPPAADTILREAQGAPSRLPSVTAKVIISHRQQGDAPAIIRAVVAAAPLSQASSIVAALGAEFAAQPQLVRLAPEIAAAFTQALLGKLSQGASVAQVRTAIAESVGTLTVSLPGTVQANHDRIVAIGQAVAGVLGPRYASMAPSIVAATSAALKASAGASNVAFVLGDFLRAFGKVDCLAVGEKLDPEAVGGDGKGFKDIIPLDPQGAVLDPVGSRPVDDLPMRRFWYGNVTAPEM